MSRFTPQCGVVKEGTYDGNDTANRGIPHGLGRKPKVILGSRDGFARIYKIIVPGVIEYVWDGASTLSTVDEWDETYFYVGNVASYFPSMNASGETFYWVAIG